MQEINDEDGLTLRDVISKDVELKKIVDEGLNQQKSHVLEYKNKLSAMKQGDVPITLAAGKEDGKSTPGSRKW